MKLIYTILSIFAASCILISCNKDASSKESSSKQNVEGTWGVTHMEMIIKINGELNTNYNEDFDPLHPSSGNEMKYTMKSLGGDRYQVTAYSWNSEESVWEPHDAGIKIIKGNTISTEDGQTVDTFTLTSDTLTVVHTSETETKYYIDYMTGEYIELPQISTITSYKKTVLKRM